MYEIPVKDASCAVPIAGNYNDQIKKCCGDDAPIISYNNDCASYCLAVDQTVKDLTECLYDGGVKWKDVFCAGNETATATGEATGGATAATKTKTASASGTDTGTSTARSENSSTTTSTGGAVSSFFQGWPVSKGTISIFAFLLSAAVAGAAM